MRRVLPIIFAAAALVSALPRTAVSSQQAAPLWPDDRLLWQSTKRCRPTAIGLRPECEWLRHVSQARPGTAELDQTGYVKGLYLIHSGIGSSQLREHVKTLIETTELNSIVIDVKGDFGFLAYPSKVEMAREIGADRKPRLGEQEWAEFMQWFAERGIYTIARIVTFKDEPLAVAHPEWAVTDSETGELWRDGEVLAWADPSFSEVQDYNIALAVEAAQMGFDEVQFDYVRFPSDGRISRATFAQENTRENRVRIIAGFLEKAKLALEPLGVKLAADVFGYAT